MKMGASTNAFTGVRTTSQTNEREPAQYALLEPYLEKQTNKKPTQPA